MPTLLLSSRQTDDAQKLWRACIDEKWEVVRVYNWRVPKFRAPYFLILTIHLLASLVRLCVPLHPFTAEFCQNLTLLIQTANLSP
jgi:hypothetical protein